jgi:putative sigma-54 modulation protein
MRIATHINEADLRAEIQSYVERRLRFALGRFSGRVGEVTVRIRTDGRTERFCRISVGVLPFGHVTVDESSPNLFAAIDQATGRIGWLFGRELERNRQSKLGRGSMRTAA